MQGVKGQKAADKAERERIRARMEEDKQEKLERLKQQKFAAEEATAAAQSAYAAAQATRPPCDSSTLSIRSEDGALRHTFSASTTLLQVREWLLQEQPAMSRPDSIIYFMTMMPRAEYLSEERMGTTLAEAGLTPDGTVMVRRQLVAPPPPAASRARVASSPA